jgi:hypothetical protein
MASETLFRNSRRRPCRPSPGLSPKCLDQHSPPGRGEGIRFATARTCSPSPRPRLALRFTGTTGERAGVRGLADRRDPSPFRCFPASIAGLGQVRTHFPDAPAFEAIGVVEFHRVPSGCQGLRGGFSGIVYGVFSRKRWRASALQDAGALEMARMIQGLKSRAAIS